MQTIFIMVKCRVGKAYAVAEAAMSVEHVSEVYSTSGQYDLLVKCYLDEKMDVGHFVTSRIQTWPT
jgi:DNA-binding Lrp family transcriptional regulator